MTTGMAMMTIQDVVSALSLQVAAGDQGLDNKVSGGYASDLLSCVMAGAAEANLWVTLQAHPNVVAVADLLNLAGVLITEGAQPDDETVSRANEKGIPLLLTSEHTFVIVGKLCQLGISGS